MVKIPSKIPESYRDSDQQKIEWFLLVRHPIVNKFRKNSSTTSCVVSKIRLKNCLIGIRHFLNEFYW